MNLNQIIVALDGMTREQALTTAWTLSSHVWGFKVNDLLLTYGVNIIEDLKCLGNVFADPKFYDIPNTVANGVSRLAEAGADLITVHASAGKESMQAALDSAGNAKILAVTVLTSMTESQVREVYCRSIDETVWDLAYLAKEVGIHGIVCSSQELELIRHLDMLKVVPGIRLDGQDDHCRIGDGAGADLFVIGRPITKASDPVAALKKFVK